MGFPSGSAVKKLPAMQDLQEMHVLSLDWEDSLEEEMEDFKTGKTTLPLLLRKPSASESAPAWARISRTTG